MKRPTYYTVIIGKRSCIVKYAQPPDYSVKLFSGSFADPGEASQEIIKALHTEPLLFCPTEGAFEREVNQLSNQHKQDLAKLADWNSGRTIRI